MAVLDWCLGVGHVLVRSAGRTWLPPHQGPSSLVAHLVAHLCRSLQVQVNNQESFLPDSTHSSQVCSPCNTLSDAV